LLLFDKINIYKDDEAGGKELYKSAVPPLNDIMYAYGTAVHLKGKIKKTEEDYLSMFFRVRRTIDLNQEFVNSTWAKAAIGFKNARVQYYTGKDILLKKKIEEFKGLYTDLKNLKAFCERKDRSLKGERYLFSWDNFTSDNDNKEKLIRFLRDDFDMDLAEDLEILRYNNGITISNSKDGEEKKAEIKMEGEKEKVTLKICGGGVVDLKVKKENGKLNIYGDRIYEWK
jgi:transposase-like protein